MDMCEQATRPDRCAAAIGPRQEPRPPLASPIQVAANSATRARLARPDDLRNPAARVNHS